MSMSSMSIESEDNGEFDAIATGERSDGDSSVPAGGTEGESAPDVRVEGMDDDDSFSLRSSPPSWARDSSCACVRGPRKLREQPAGRLPVRVQPVMGPDVGDADGSLHSGSQRAPGSRHRVAPGSSLGQCPTRRYSLWIVTELAIIASDVPEVIGTALALKLIFGLPTVWGVLVTSASTLLFLALQQFGVRKLEAFMGSLVGVMSVCFVAQMGMLEGGDGGEVIKGIVVPIFQNGKALFIGISIIGAVVMPHNLSSTRRSCCRDRLSSARGRFDGAQVQRRGVRAGSGRHVGHNFAVTIVAAQSIRDADFDDPTGEKRQGIIDRPLQNADMLKDVLGKSAKGLFAAALLASGQSSTITGTYAGQFVMEGFLEIKINRFFARSDPDVRHLAVAAGHDHRGRQYAEFLIVISSVFLSFQLPFALIPLVKFCGSEKIVGAMAIDPRVLQRTWVIVSAIVFANIVLLCVWVHESGAVNGSPGGVFLGLSVALFMILYCASLSALALRPVTQNLTMQVRDRLENKDFDRLDASAEGEEYI